ncbi:Peroxisomal NADH pyrophosphatase NUDT12 [Trametes pubescens]|uniref:NAD(+) diphosphatase n=1 Tax=Trametes pubescens TaxID=154538 RepID=A0A1M2VML2_TRAPU|nr:Peroxisomal NADH pyrophosphatase NUDT12 [Trametes pubescens]
MGDTYVNFFGGSPLNRLAWLRTSQPFLNAIAHAPATRWVLFKDGQPLVQSKPSAPTLSLARLTTNDVKALLGPEPYFAQGQHAGDLAPPDVPALEAARLRGNGVVFLGLHETNRSHADALPSSDFSAKTSADVVLSNIKGTAYFSLDVSNVAQSELDETLQNAAAAKEGDRIVFSEPRTATASFDAFDAAVFAEARSMTDWNARNKKKWPGKFYSCLAGFIEPGETFEDAVRRELWEEAGVKVWNVRYHSTQPWPYPANLMGGFYATASSSEPLRVDLDNELEEARWWTRDEILGVIHHRDGTTLSQKDRRELFTAAENLKPTEQPSATSGANPLSGDAVKEGEQAAVDAAREASAGPLFKMPPVTAVAGVLINEWAHGRAGFQPESPKL